MPTRNHFSINLIIGMRKVSFFTLEKFLENATKHVTNESSFIVLFIIFQRKWGSFSCLKKLSCRRKSKKLTMQKNRSSKVINSELRPTGMWQYEVFNNLHSKDKKVLFCALSSMQKSNLRKISPDSVVLTFSRGSMSEKASSVS